MAMKILPVIPFIFWFFVINSSFAGSGEPSIEDENTPIEQSDVHSLHDTAEPAAPIEDEATPMEQEDVKTIDQVNESTDLEDESTPIEREDGPKPVGE